MIWSQLRDHPAWQLLKQEVISALAGAPDIDDMDSKEAFLYQSIKAKELLKFLNTPEDRIALIESLNQPQ